MGLVGQTSSAIIIPMLRLWDSFLTAVPGLVAAIIILVVGYLVGVLLGYVVTRILVQTKVFSWLVNKTHTKKLLGKSDLNYFFGAIVKWYVFILFLNPAAEVTNLTGFAIFLSNLAIWIPNLIAAVVIALLGFIFAVFIKDAVVKTKAIGANVIGDILKIIILVFTAIISLAQLGINVTIAQNAFLIILGGIVFAISLALGLGFGLGMKDEAKIAVKQLKKKF